MKILLLIIICFIYSNTSIGQNNIIPNPGFENGQPGSTVDCGYGVPGHASLIDNDILDWLTASCSGCDFEFGSTDWMDDNCTQSLIAHSKFIYMQGPGTDVLDNYNDALRVQLFSNLAAYNYLFKIKYASVPRKTGAQDGSDACRIRIYLSKYSSHWFSTWGNVHLSWVMYPPSYTNGWSEHWVIIPSGLLSYLGSDLHNIVLTAEQSQFYVDYVELSKACDSPVLIENHGFYANMNELPYKSSGTLKAGYDVGSSFGNGNVIINNSATQIFKSQNNIFLEPGFEAVQGSNFQTFIESCDNRSANRIMQDSIPDIIVNEDRIQILNCGEDSLSISGLDGDTSNYTFSWNFGNGVNSTDKVAKIYYSVPGTYLVTMILTDSNNIIVTLTKTYIVPDCTRKNNLHMKESKIIIYPNPSDGNFTVDIGSIEVGVEKLEIYSMLGNVIYATSKITENKLLQFSLKENKRGLYIIKFMTNDGTVISKLIELNN